jgi:hypothetical protein
MKLRDLLYSTEHRVNSHFVGLHRPLRFDLTRILTRYEENFSWEELLSLLQAADLEQDLTGLSDDSVRELLEPFKSFLAKRWERIKPYPALVYTNNSKESLTITCETLAAELADTKMYTVKDFVSSSSSSSSSSLPFNIWRDPEEPLHRFELLMPGIQAMNQVTRCSLNDEDPNAKMKLNHFILDDALNIIHIQECLEEAHHSTSYNDGDLMHTSLLSVTGTKLALSPLDKARVLHHSKEAREWWRAICELRIYRTQSDTIGGHLTKLAISLRSSGVHGLRGGTNDDATEEAFLGILTFYHYLKTLTEENYEYLMKCGATTLESDSFKYIWAKLIYMTSFTWASGDYIPPEEIIEAAVYMSEVNDRNAQDYRYLVAFSCVDQTGNAILRLLDKNPILYSMTARSELAQARPQQFVARIYLNFASQLQKEKSNFIDKEKKNKLTHYTSQEISALPDAVILAGIDGNFLKTFPQKITFTTTLFFKLLKSVPKEFQFELLNECFGQNYCLLRISSVKKLCIGLKILFESSRGHANKNEQAHNLLLNLLGPEHIDKIFTKRKHVNSLTSILPFDLVIDFLNKRLGLEKIKSLFTTDDEIREYIKCFTKGERKVLYDFFGISPAVSRISSLFLQVKNAPLFFQSIKDKGTKRKSDELEEDNHKKLKTTSELECDEDLDEDMPLISLRRVGFS